MLFHPMKTLRLAVYLPLTMCVTSTLCPVSEAIAAPLTLQDSLVDLNEAVQLYQVGDRAQALQLLLSLSSDDNYPQSIQQEARIYIAEIMIMEENTDGARQYFEDVLRVNPNYSIDRFRHPPEVCAEFDYTNAQWRQQQSSLLTPTSKNTVWQRFVPFGIYQLQRKQQWKGILYASLQTGTAISSVVLFNYLQQNPGYNQNDLDEKARLETILTLQRASAIGFYSVWLISTIDAQRDWQLENQD